MKRRLSVVGYSLQLTMRADRLGTWVSGLLTVVLAGVSAGTALSQRWLLNASGAGSGRGVLLAAALGVVAFVLNASINRVVSSLRLDLMDKAAQELTQEVLTITATLPGVEHLERADYLDRLVLLRRGAWSVAVSCWSILLTVANVASLALSVWLLASVHPAMILLAVLAVPPLLTGRKAERLLRDFRDSTGEAVRREAILHELCLDPDTATELRITGGGPELDRMANASWQEVSQAETSARRSGLLWRTAGWTCYAAGLTLALAVVLTVHSLSAGDIVLTISIAMQLRFQISVALDNLDSMGEVGRVTEHYLWLKDHAETRRRGSLTAPSGLGTGISVSGVSFRYPGSDTPVLRDLNLELRPGSTVGLVGVNGAGKTTLVKLLCGLYQPDKGMITVAGQPLAGLDPTSWLARCSGAFQDFVKFHLPVRETVGIGDLPRMRDEAAVAEALDRAGGSVMIATLPDGMDTQLGPLFGGVDLSHGQWQKLALARGAMRDHPLLLVLDEPTAALDPQAEHDLFEKFAALARNGSDTITLLVSHRFSTVHMADHIIVLGDGELLEQGTHAALMAANGPYATLYATQANAYHPNST
ncbi:ABC transporter ATP-binding protein [Nonomuraea sp. NPDC050786]|uniref:ABC transporter ATP-binding protein n=1 Tax=Nonomuraea sp. NPDC050786 TaxID=3154840 RepID=UPI0033EA93D2